MTAVTVTFLTRKGCTLCDETLPRVERAALRLGIEVLVEDVDESGQTDEYGDRVPVILGSDRRVLAWGRIGDARVMVALLRARLGG